MSSRALFLLPLATLLILAGFFGWSLMSGRDPASIGSAVVNRPVPPFAVPALREGEPALTDALFKTGKPVLLNFFASWCAPCLIEHPLLLRLKERDGATIVGVAWKNKPEDANAWLKKLGDPFKYAGLDLEGRTSLDWGLSAVPETYLIDGTGVVRLHYRRAINERDVTDSILPLLKAAK
jgi:cytochrome c biogenesis protein CcmG/thiol:disulfide interchange protein DsbE